MSGAVIIIITPPPPPPTKPSGSQQQRAEPDSRLTTCLGHNIGTEGSPSRWVRLKSGVALIAEALRP